MAVAVPLDVGAGVAVLAQVLDGVADGVQQQFGRLGVAGAANQGEHAVVRRVQAGPVAFRHRVRATADEHTPVRAGDQVVPDVDHWFGAGPGHVLGLDGLDERAAHLVIGHDARIDVAAGVVDLDALGSGDVGVGRRGSLCPPRAAADELDAHGHRPF